MERKISALQLNTSQLNKNAESVTESFVTEIFDLNQARNNQENLLEAAVKDTDNICDNSGDLARQRGIELGENQKMTQLLDTSNVHDSYNEPGTNNSTSLSDVGCSSLEHSTFLNAVDSGGNDRSTDAENTFDINNLSHTETSAPNGNNVDIKSKITDERRSNEPSLNDAQEMQALHQELQLITRQTQEHIENADTGFLMVDIGGNVDDQMMSDANEQSLQGSESLPIIVASDDEVELVCIRMNNSTNSPNKQKDKTSQDKSSPESGLECDSSSIKPKRRKEGSSSPRDHVCSICLDEFENKSFLDQCFHAFCYYCIIQWAEIIKTCPLCKTSFTSVIHSVKSMTEYEQHYLPDSQPKNSSSSNNQHSQERRRFHYRTTLTGGTSSGRARGSWESRVRGREAIMAAKRKKELTAREARRAVYTNRTWVQGITQQGRPKFRDISPGFFRANPACTHRLVPWLTRELQVLLNDDPNHVEFVRRVVLSLINKIAIDSDEFAEQVRSFLFDRAEQFVHEFASFARAPFDMTAYDARAQYNIPAQSERSDTPTIISHTSGWETPDVTGHLAAAPWETSPRDESLRESPNWSPLLQPGVTVSQQQGVITVTQDKFRSRVFLREDNIRQLSRRSSSRDSVDEIDIKVSTFADTSVNEDSMRSRGTERHNSCDETEDGLRSRSRKHKQRHKNKHRHKHKHKHRSGNSHGETLSDPHSSECSSKISVVDLVVLSSDSLSSQDINIDKPEQKSKRFYKKHSSGHKNTNSSRNRSRSRSPHQSRSRSSSRQCSRSKRYFLNERANSASLEDVQNGVKLEGSCETKCRKTKEGTKNQVCSMKSKKHSRQREQKGRKRTERSEIQDNNNTKPVTSSSETLTSSSETLTSSSETLTRACSVSRELGLPDDKTCDSTFTGQSSSPTEAEMKQEIAELEKRIAADKKRLLQLMLKSETRKQIEKTDDMDGVYSMIEEVPVSSANQENDKDKITNR